MDVKTFAVVSHVFKALFKFSNFFFHLLRLDDFNLSLNSLNLVSVISIQLLRTSSEF